MSSLDIVILVVIAIGLARGFYSGVIRQAAEIVGIVLSFILALQLMGPLGESISAATGWSQSLARALGFLLIFVAVQVAMYLLARLLERVVGMLRLTVLNRAAGALLGGFKIALFLSIAFLVLGLINVPNESGREASTLYEPVAGLVPKTWDFIAEHLPALKRLSDEFGREVEHLVS